jgi:8-oxo-dGTP pyrophosphatase MutT (NUDIX family)
LSESTGRDASPSPERDAASAPSGHWQVFGERTVYASDRIDVVLADVQEPHGPRVPEHHLVRCHIPAAACLVAHPERGLLLIRRHRFIVGTWGWEIPGGGIEPSEDPADAARREVEEETGWRPRGDLQLLVRYHPSSGLLDQTFRCYLATDAEQVGAPTSPGEAAEIRWLQPSVVEELLEAGDVVDGMAVTALYAWLRRFGPPRRT